jgi:type IV pilus assembly protein PilA
MTARNRAPLTKEGGFTLIELIVVLGIMSILIGLGVPSYVSLQQSVQNAATRSDLGSDRIALVSWGIDNNGVVPAQIGFDPSPSGLNLVGYGWSKSTETMSYAYSTNTSGTAWCLEMTSTSGTVYRVSQNKVIGTGTCSSLGSAY